MFAFVHLARCQSHQSYHCKHESSILRFGKNVKALMIARLVVGPPHVTIFIQRKKKENQTEYETEQTLPSVGEYFSAHFE